MKKHIPFRAVFLLILAVILIAAALWNMLSPQFDRWQSKREYEKLAQDYVSIGSTDGSGGEDSNQTEDTRQKKKDWWYTDVKVEFDELKKQNPDIVAWIRFDSEELAISYPVLYSGDNEKYVRTDVYGNDHIAGSIFLEGLNSPDFSDYYNIIYGHSMKNGTMFGNLKKYRTEGFWQENQYFTVYTEHTAYRYHIFSYETAPDGGEVYKIGYQPGEEYQEFIDHMIENSQIETGITPQSTNKILTLSTCVAVDSDERFAVHAVCIDTQTTDAEKLKE